MNKKGFTLIEILIVIAIVAFLSTSMFFGFENYSQRSLALKSRNSVIEFINKSQNFINFENWKDSPEKKLIFEIKKENFSLKDSDQKVLYESKSNLNFDIRDEFLTIEFESPNKCKINDNLDSKTIILYDANNQKALEIFSDNKNCYLEILKI